MKVYVVISGFDASDNSIDGVFSTREKAEAFIEQSKKYIGYFTYEIEEKEVDVEYAGPEQHHDYKM